MPKFYAVKAGRTPGIYTSWAAAKEQVDGFSGAEYKSFGKKSEAQEYLGIKRPEKPKPPMPNTREGAPCPAPYSTACDAAAYVDGSYNVKTGEYAFGAVFLCDEKMYAFSHKYSDENMAKMHNVAGELAGAVFAMRYAIKLGLGSVEIFHDYEGIAKWATGAWKANLDATRAYVQLYRRLSAQIAVKFTKVRGHSGNLYNDFADLLAKGELGIK